MLHGSDDEDDAGPSVESADPEERIQARRLRIQKRIEQQKREAMGEDAVAKKETSDEMGKGKQQVEESRNRLQKLKSDGMELVTNVRVACDAREMQHRLQDAESKHTRIERLDAEAKTSSEKFEEISRRWSAAKMKEVPHDLHEMLLEQTKGCDTVIDEKNKLINELQLELKQKDDEYVKDLKKQSEDVDLMIERMEEQVKNLTKSYRDELLQIEESFIEERGQAMENNKNKWEGTMGQRGEREEEYLKSRFKRVDDHELQLDTLRTNDTEEYNMVKIKLETDVQILEQQLQQMKATYQLNQEKLEYNFQVLKKRDEENTITKSQQKRKITRLQDTLNSLRLKLAKQEKHFKEENQNLVDEYKRIADQHKELYKKMRHFSANDWKKFQDIWKMNEDEVRSLVDNVLKADETIHLQQLGLPWNVPDMPFLKSHGPLEVQTSDPRPTATSFAKEILAANEKAQKKSSDDLEVIEKPESRLSLGAVKKLLEVLCDEAGFLVEEKLNKLLQPLQSDERSLIKLDAIFKALNIETEDDVTKLSNFFSQHGKLVSKADATSEEESDNTTEDAEVLRISADAEGSSTSTEPEDFMHPNEILDVLKNFVQEHIKPAKEKPKSSVMDTLSGTANRDPSLDAAHWELMANVIDSNKLKMWDALSNALTKYHNVLTERANRIQETDSLRQQNAELRMLLHQYISSKVNQELEIPPTRILQLEYS
ncbi:dynein regulatory complex protein 1-like [Clavelina lepadiformis]|uniref:Dynein regulatory complex protein 1 n=1 Tax=Clavelina lepadiformis TaxID=159417 RepID=A0ABP0FP02_CLALP